MAVGREGEVLYGIGRRGVVLGWGSRSFSFSTLLCLGGNLNITTITHVARCKALRFGLCSRCGWVSAYVYYMRMYIIYIYITEDGILNILRSRGRVGVRKVFDREKKTKCTGRVTEEGTTLARLRNTDTFYRLRRVITYR
jgi:hypothetical protein